MAVLKRRDRIVVFRLTKEEYKRLERACSTTGARNLSDYTRRELLDTHDAGDRIEGRLSKFEKRLGEVQSTLRQIRTAFERLANDKS